MFKKIVILILALSFSLKPLTAFVEKNSSKGPVQISFAKIQDSTKNLTKNGSEKSSEEQESEGEELAFLNSYQTNLSSTVNQGRYERMNSLSKLYLSIPTPPPSLFL